MKKTIKVKRPEDIPFYDDFGVYEDRPEFMEDGDHNRLLILTVSVIFLLFTIMLFVYQNSRIQMLETDIETLRGFIRELQ